MNLLMQVGIRNISLCCFHVSTNVHTFVVQSAVSHMVSGYVGEGMLTGAIAGSVFASPPTGSILAAIHKVGKCTDGQ